MATNLVVDVGGLSYWKLYSVANKEHVKSYGQTKETLLALENESGFKTWQHEFVMQIFEWISQYNPDKLTLACDGNKLWRKDIYPEYKANRKAQKATIPINWNLFYATRDKLCLFLGKMLPIKTMLIDSAEADDVVAIITKRTDDKILAFSEDHDWYQLFQYNNYSQYKLKTGEEVIGVDPKMVLNMKILTGDRGDNIPNIRPKMGEVSARKALVECDNNVYNYACKMNLLENYMFNTRLIDFKYIPDNVEEEILNLYNKPIIEKINHMELMNFLQESYEEFTNLMNKSIFAGK